MGDSGDGISFWPDVCRWVKCICLLEPHGTLSNADDGVYMRRYWILPRNKLFNIYLHRYYEGDDRRYGRHNHPWASFSILLKGGYAETVEEGGETYGRVVGTVPDGLQSPYKKCGRFVYRGADVVHCIEAVVPRTTTLFITGRRRKNWGFVGDG